MNDTELPRDQTSELPDPWTVSEPFKQSEPPRPWHFEPEAHPLLTAAESPQTFLMQEGNPNTLQLPSSNPSSELDATAILVEDELKLRETAL